jgi:hypothetical protein
MLRLLNAFVDALYFYSNNPAALLTADHSKQVFNLILLGAPYHSPVALVLLALVGLRLDPLRARCTEDRIAWL